MDKLEFKLSSEPKRCSIPVDRIWGLLPKWRLSYHHVASSSETNGRYQWFRDLRPRTDWHLPHLFNTWLLQEVVGHQTKMMSVVRPLSEFPHHFAEGLHLWFQPANSSLLLQVFLCKCLPSILINYNNIIGFYSTSDMPDSKKAVTAEMSWHSLFI